MFNYVHFLFLGLAVVLASSLLTGILRPIIVVICLMDMVFVLSRSWKMIDKLQRLTLGLEGEEYTGQELNLLMRSGAFVFHDIPYQYGNIDHIVIGRDKVFAVETKAFRKPQALTGGKAAKVVFDGERLKFPNSITNEPVLQAKRHAEFLAKSIKKACGFDFLVYAVIALPGWYVENESSEKKVGVINPKRGKSPKGWLGDLEDRSARDRVASYIASVARSVSYDSDKTDPDASENYDFWLNPGVKGKRTGAIGDLIWTSPNFVPKL